MPWFPKLVCGLIVTTSLSLRPLVSTKFHPQHQAKLQPPLLLPVTLRKPFRSGVFFPVALPCVAHRAPVLTYQSALRATGVSTSFEKTTLRWRFAPLTFRCWFVFWKFSRRDTFFFNVLCSQTVEGRGKDPGRSPAASDFPVRRRRKKREDPGRSSVWFCLLGWKRARKEKEVVRGPR